MATLYEIHAQIEECVDMETGEIIDQERLDKLDMEWTDKIENIALWYKNLLSDADQYKIEKDNFAKKEKSARNKAGSIKNYLDNVLQGDRLKTAKVNITYRKSESVEIEDIAKVDDDYLKYSEPTADKMKIKKSLKEGIDIKGARLVENQNIQIK